jgi:hypothetical protein
MTTKEALAIVDAAREAVSSGTATPEELGGHVSTLCETLEQAVEFILVLQMESDMISKLLGPNLMSLLAAQPPEEEVSSDEVVKVIQGLRADPPVD